MINITKLKIFPFYTREVFVPFNDVSKFNIIFFPENSSFLESYFSLKIRRQYAKKITYLPFKVPKLIVNIKSLFPYKRNLKLIPQVPSTNISENCFIDAGPFLDRIDAYFGKSIYTRKSLLVKIKTYLQFCSSFGGNKKTVLLYYVDVTKDVPDIIQKRRAWSLISMARETDGKFPFDIVCIVRKTHDSTKYISIYNSRQTPLAFPKIFSILKKMSSKEKLRSEQ